MRKFVLAGVIATLGVAMLAIPASASFDRHFSVIEKQVSGGPVGENGFRFKSKLLQPHNRDNHVGRDKGNAGRHRTARSGAAPSSTSMARWVASAISASGAISGGVITGSTSSGEPVISTASAARCCSSARTGSTSTWCANEDGTREGCPGCRSRPALISTRTSGPGRRRGSSSRARGCRRSPASASA